MEEGREGGKDSVKRELSKRKRESGGLFVSV